MALNEDMRRQAEEQIVVIWNNPDKKPDWWDYMELRKRYGGDKPILVRIEN